MAIERKVILITGAGDGIGRSIALELGKGNNHLILLSKSEDRLKEVSSKIKNSRYFICDITNDARINDIIGKIEKVYERIDVLVNNAGVWIEGELDKNNVNDIRTVLDVNILGQIQVTKAVIPLMKKNKSGLIINIISQAGLYAKSERSVYDASKFGMTGFTRALQEDLHKYGIRVSGVYPSKVNTSLFSKAGIDKNMKGAILPEDVAQVVTFIVSRQDNVEIPEIGIKDLNY